MSNDSSLERRRAATGSFNSRRSQQSVDSLSSNALLTQSAAITSMFAQENRSLSKSTDYIIDPSSALPNQQNNHLEEKSFIKVGDLIYFLSDENIAVFGEGVGSLCGRKNDDSLKTDFLGAIFRVQPKYEYSAQSEFNKYSSSKSPDADKLEKYEENVQNEKKRNSEEERVLGGSSVYYGQVIQLVHFATNMVLSGDKKQRSDLDPGSLKLELRKEASKNCWFKIMPRYKVRFEGEEVRQFDKICLIHVKSGMFVKLSDKTYEDNDNNEVHLNSQSTSWTVSHFMSFHPEGDQFIKAGDVIRIFHQEKEGFLKANIAPLFGDSHYDLFLKVKGKKSNSSETKSSNTLFLVELKQNIGGMIAWRTEVRLKHLGTGKYLAINYNAKDSSKLNLILTEDLKTYEQDTLFIFNPVDPGTNFISFGTYCRIQGKKIGDKKPHWMHVADFIENKKEDLGDKGEDENNMSFARNKYLEIQFTEKFHYEDAVLFKPVPPIEIEELNYVNSLYAVLIDFAKKLKVNSLTDSNGNSNFATAIKKSRTNIGILPPDTDPVKDTLKKLIAFVNKSDEEDPLKQDGIPISGHQTLLFEQQMIEASIDILVHLFGFTEKSFGTVSEINADSKEKFAREIGKKENKHILELVTLIYKFLQMIVKENYKLGMLVSQWMNIFLTHMGTGVGVRKTLIELFKDNKTLLETIPTKTIDAFVQLLLESGKDAKLLEFLVVVCTCNDSPVLRNQMYILDCLHKNPQLLFSTRPSKDGKNFEINVGVKEEVWIPFEEFVKAKVYKKKTVSDGTKAEENTKEDQKKSQYDYPYNTRYMKEIDYFKQLLQLYYRVCLANDKAVLFLSEGDKESKIPPLMTSDMVFSCLRNDNLPGSLRSYFCDLLYLWVDKDLPASPNSGVKYTWSWDEIVGDYVVKRITEDETKDAKNSWTTKNLTELQHFLFHFLQKNQDLPVGDKENRSLLLSALVVLSKMVNYGFFIEAKDQESLIPVLLQIVNGKTEITPQSTKFSRFEMTESNWPLIKTKLQVCKILHSFYDVRLEKKTAEQLYKYKTFYESDSKEERKKNLGLITASASSEEEKSDDPNEIALRSITYQPTYDEKIRSILLDTSLYQYEPLTTSALSLLLRHMRSRDELISTLDRVQLLTDDESVKLYHHITKQIGKLQQILEDNDISTDDSPQIVEIIKDFIRKCCVEDDMNRPNLKSQTLFRNLNVHNEIIRVLKLRYRDEYHYIFKLCYLFLKMFCQNNKTNQEILFPLLDFMLSQMGMQLNIADTLIALVKENYNICSQLDSFFIGHMAKLLYAKGHKPRYVHLLDAIVCAEDKTVKENQTIVATQVLAKRDVILTNYYELKKKALDGSASNLAVVTKSKQEASVKEGKEEENKDDLLKKRAKLARINTTLASMTEGLDFKIDLETYELINATKVTKDEDELLYHVAIIDLLAKTCKDKNHATEALCQALYTVPEIIKIIRDGEAGPLVKAAYTRFLSEVWLFTERPLNLHMDEQIWDLIRFYREDIKKFKKISPMENNYIFEGVLFILRTFFSCEFPELSSERIAVCNDLLSALIDMLAKFKHDAHKVNSIINTILQITASSIKGINSTIGTEKVNEIIEKARKSLGTMGHKTLKNLRRELIEEKRKTAYLKMYIRKLAEEKATGSSKTILVEEFDKIVRLFKDKLMKKKKKKDEKEAGSNNFMKRKGAQYVQKLIVQLQSEEEDKKLIIDCLSILTAMIDLEDAPIEKLSVKKLGKTLAELKEPDKKKLELIWREKVQNRLGELGAMNESIPLFKSTSPALIYSALTLCCAMLAGGNRRIQEKMMEFFLSTPDPHFFDDIRSRIAGAVTELKNKRRQANTIKRRNISSQGSVMLDENELDEIFEVSSSKKENEKDNIQKLLLFMQNLCEGHYTEMKDYLREQWDNTKSFNLVKECVSLATELERGVEEYFELANQLFRTLNEFASGCAGNQATIAEAKVHVSFNRIMARFPQCNNDDILELKSSMLDLMLSLVEGMFPEKETATSFVPDVLVENVDFLALEATMENGIKFSEVRSDFEVLQLNIQRRQKLMQQQLMKTVVALGDSGAADEQRETLPEVPAKERAETLEESQKTKNVVSKCLILMQILAKYDDDKKTQAKAILKKTEWANYSQENIGNIELLNESGELEQVYFTIPPVCHNLQEATKEEFLKVVKRESPTDKIDDFVRRSGTLQYEIYHHSKLAKSKVHFLSALYTPIRNLLLLITVIVNGLMIGLYDGETLQYSEYTRYIFYGLCGLHLLISTAWVGVYMWMWAPVIIFRRVQDRKEELREANVLLRKEGKKLHSTEIGWFRKMSFLLTDGLLVYHFLFWFFSVVSIPYFPVMAFHMIDLSVRSDGVVNVVKAVTTNGRSLILTAVLLINLIYIYTVIGYFGLPSSYASNNCENLYVCILYNINAGIRNGGGIGDVLGDVAPGDSTYIGRFFFDLTFFLIIIILGLNIVFGIILDTFGQLRDQKSFIEEDMRSKCFICGIDSDTFQRQALGFKHHIKHDHNMWSYLYFFIYLDEKDQDEYTFIEEYVAEKRKAGENDYFPISKAICLKSKKKKKGG